MRRLASILVFTAIAASAPLNCIAAEEPGPAPLNCETGPLSKTFGQTNWLVYACDDEHSLVVVSAEGNPAMPFYFMFAWKGGAYELHGEGTGNKKATQAAFDELSKLDISAIEALLREVAKGTKSP